MWMLHRPSQRQLIEFLMRAADQPLNAPLYPSLALVQLKRRVHLGSGIPLFRRCRQAMRRWSMIPDQMVDLYWPQRSACEGTTIATGARCMGLYWLNPCRVTECSGMDAEGTDDQTPVRVRWETVRGHCVVGHETFRLVLEQRTGNIYYEISSSAAPVPWIRPASRRILRLRCQFQQLSCERFQTVARRLSRLGSRDSGAPARRAHQPGWQSAPNI